LVTAYIGFLIVHTILFTIHNEHYLAIAILTHCITTIIKNKTNP